MSRVEQARRAAGMTQNEAAAILGVSYPTYLKKEQDPSLFTFAEFNALGQEMDDISKGIMMGAIDEVSASVEKRDLMGMTLGDCMWAIGHAARLQQQLSRFRAKNFASRV